VTIALAATAHASLAGSIVLATSTSWAADQKPSAAAQKLIDQAKKAFDDASYDESLQLLSAALLKLDIVDDQRIEAYRLLAYNYILLKKEDAAKSAAYKLYALNEDFELSKGESPRFREPFAKWKQQWIDDGRPGKAAATAKPPATVTIKHSPPAEIEHDKSVAITGDVQDPDHRVAKIVMHYRPSSDSKFQTVEAKLALGGFQVNIPGSAVQPPLVEYYLEAIDDAGLPIAGRGDTEAPLRIVVKGEEGGSIFGTWWFWTGTAAVVVGGVLGAILLTRKSSSTGPGGNNPTSNVTITIGE
jgi:hypothetical protein